MAPPPEEVLETVPAPEEAQEVYRIPLSGYTPEQMMRLGVADPKWAQRLTQATKEQLEKVLLEALEEGWFSEDVIEGLLD